MGGGPIDLREVLKAETRAAHDRLDRMSAAMPLSGNADYAAFLQAQGSARHAFERAFATTAPFGLAAPPLQTPAVAADLSCLGQVEPSAAPAVHLADPFEALGAAWVIAGSSLGNRAMLAARRKAGLTTANAFFEDRQMPAYFGRVITALQADFALTQAAAILNGAHGAFAVFENAFSLVKQAKAA